MSRVLVIDGQGGGMGRALVEAVKKSAPDVHVRALGTNALALVIIGSILLRSGIWANNVVSDVD